MSVWGTLTGSAISGAFGNANTGGSASTWGSIFKGVTGGNSGSFWGDLIGGVLGGGSGGGGSGTGGGWGNIFSAMLGGIQGSADAKLTEAMVNKQGEWKLRDTQESGRQQRLTLDFTEQLKDYNAQKDKARKRAALDTYGAFSLTQRYAPSMPATPPVQLPTKPTVG